MVKRYHLVGLPFVLLLIMNSKSFAQTPVINNTTINYATTPNRMAVAGSNFSSSGAAPTVVFNGVTLTLVSFSNTSIVANLPTALASGSYTATITNNMSNNKQYSSPYIVTYGA